MKNISGTLNTSVRTVDLLKTPVTEKNDNNVVFSDDITVVEKNGYTIYFAGDIYNIEGNKKDKVRAILTAFIENGTGSFKLLDGEFTFAIYSNNEIIIYRDRHGAGPQVFYNKEFFSSSLKNFLLLKNFTPEPDVLSLSIFVSRGYVPTPMCSLKGVNKLQAGSTLWIKEGEQTVEKLFTWEDYCSTTANISEKEATSQYEELHKKAIRNRVKGKEKVGLLLSGGYDSAGNISALREVYNGDARSFTIGFKNNPWTELPLAKILSEKYGTTHHEYEIDGSEIIDLPEIVEFLGDPFQEGGLMVNYSAMKLIGEEKPDIILGGDGNDQHFGDSGKELALHFMSRKYGFRGFQKLFAQAAKLDVFDKDNALFRTQFHNNKILNPIHCNKFGFQDAEMKKLLKHKEISQSDADVFSIPDTTGSFADLYRTHNFADNIEHVINQVILFKASKMATMFENNLSFPYMSTDVYNFLKTMPWNYKCKGSVQDLAKGRGTSKFLHKNYLKPKLPAEITERKKQGGFAPLPIFFKDAAQRKKLKDFILSNTAAKELFSEKELFHFFENYDKEAQNNGYWFWRKQVIASRFFNFLVISVWWELFINQKSVEEVKNQLT